MILTYFIDDTLPDFSQEIVQKILRDNGVIKHLIDTIWMQPFVTDILSVLAARREITNSAVQNTFY